MFIFTLLLLKNSHFLYYSGNWTASAYTETKKVVQSHSNFRFYFDQLKTVNGIDMIPCFATFMNTSKIRFTSNNISFVALPGENETFLLIGIDSDLPFSLGKYGKMLSYTISMHKLEMPLNFSLLCEKLDEDLRTMPLNHSLVLYYGFFMNETLQKNPFAINRSFYAEMIGNPLVNLTLVASQYDLVNYTIEGKIFGVIAAIASLLNGYAMASFMKNFSTESTILQISFPSFLMQVGADFGWAMFIFEFGFTRNDFYYEFFAVFYNFINIFFIFHMRILALLWKANMATGIDMDGDQVRQGFLDYFIVVSLLLVMSYFSVLSAWMFPYVFLPIIYSHFLPQIWYSFKYPHNKSKDNFYVIVGSISRLIPLWYFTFYKKNVAGTYSILCGSIFTSFLVLQVIIILLQNKFGGAFFLPKSMLPATFNYFTFVEPGTECSICITPIEEGEEAVRTPCGHCFHKQCLERWMEERPICPMCRAELPVIVSPEESSV